MKIAEVKREGAQQLVPLYEGQGHRIVDSFLQGIMGRAWAVFEGNGQEGKAVSALILAGDFLFPAGRPQKELAERMEDCMGSGFALAVPNLAGALQWN